MQFNLMIYLLSSAKAFIRKGFLEAISYKVQFITTIFSIFIGTFIFFTFSKLFDGTQSALLEPYNYDYFAFSLIGLALTDFTYLVAKSMSNEVRNGQLNGTLEELFISSNNFKLTLVTIASYPVVYGLLRMFVFFIIGIIFFDLELNILSNLRIFFVIILFTIISYLGISLISASYTFIFKRGDPFNSVFFGISAIFGGVIYPIEALPGWTIYISKALPITHILESLRASLISGDTNAYVEHVIALTFISLILLIGGLYLSTKAVKLAKKNGSMAHY